MLTIKIDVNNDGIWMNMILELLSNLLDESISNMTKNIFLTSDFLIDQLR